MKFYPIVSFLPLSLFLVILLSASVLPTPRAAAAADPEIRGFWIEAWSNGLKTPAQIDQLIADVRAGNFNAIIPQVRRRGDTLYFSDIEPRIEDSTLPVHFDALAYLIDRARAQDPPIEVHAWIVAYPIWRSEHNLPNSPQHVVNRHPEWLSQNYSGAQYDGNNYQHDPGHPGVQQHLFDVSMELITKYDIDGLHFDYIRLTGNTWGYNPVSVERFQRLYNRTDIPSPTHEEWRQFRRDQITQTLRKIYLSAKEVRPEVKISAATITWAPGPVTLNDWLFTSAYRHVMQDWRGWMEEGILDLNIPMAYFREHTHPDDWMKWINFTKDHRYARHAAMGPGLWLNSIENTIKQIRDTRAASPSGNSGQGVFGYSYQGTNNEGLSRSELLDALTQPNDSDSINPPVFAEPAPIPEMPWLTDPTTGHLKGFVRDGETGEIVDGALVQLSGEVQRTIQTDATGFYGFVDLPPGDYTASAGWAGDVTSGESISITTGDVAHQDLYFGEVPEEAPSILSHPSSQHVLEGSTVVFSVDASGMPAPSFQWELNATEIEGAENATLTLNSVDFGDAGEYRVIVSNASGVAVSEIATLTVESLPPRPQFTTAGIDEEDTFEAEFVGHPNSWFLVEASTDLTSWLPLTTRNIRSTPVSFIDRDWSSYERRFYRAREVSTHSLANFELYGYGTAVMFRNPSLSGSTYNHLATGPGLPDFTGITDEVPAGIDRSVVLRASWSFRSDTTNPWLRLTTHNAFNVPNPIVDFSQGIHFQVYVDRPIYLALGLRETHSSGPIGQDGGTSGDIEWVGGTTDNLTHPPKGTFIPAGEWTRVDFFIPHEPIRNHTGNGILESSTGKGVLENLTIVPADGTGIYNLYLDGFRAIELLP